MSGGFDLFRTLRDSFQRPIQLCIWGARGGGKFLQMFDFFVHLLRILLCFLLRTHPPPKGFRSSPYRPDPQVSARPRTEGGWVQNPLLNARVATFAFKAFVTISCRRPGAGTAHRQQPPQKTFARAGSQADRIRC